MSILLAMWVTLGVGHAQQVEQLEQTFAFEDIGTGASDMDWNDQNFRWRGVCDLDTSGNVRRHRVSFVATAAGASKQNDLVLAVPPGASLVTLDGVPLVPSGGVVTLLDPFKDGFAGNATGFVNTVGIPDAVGVTHEVVTVFSPAADFGGGCPLPGFELRRPAEGVVIDIDSRLDGTGPPLVGNFDGFFRAPVEQVNIATAYAGVGPYPSFLAWAADIATDGTCDTTCGATPWYDGPDLLLVDPRTAGDLAVDAPLPALPTGPMRVGTPYPRGCS